MWINGWIKEALFAVYYLKTIDFTRVHIIYTFIKLYNSSVDDKRV